MDMRYPHFHISQRTAKDHSFNGKMTLMHYAC